MGAARARTAWRRRPWVAPTIRLRLTLLYGAVFLVTGAVLLTIGYLLVRNNLSHHHQLREILLRARPQAERRRWPDHAGARICAWILGGQGRARGRQTDHRERPAHAADRVPGRAARGDDGVGRDRVPARGPSAAAAARRSPRPRGASRARTSASGSRSRARPTSCASSPTPSTGCSRASTQRSPASGISSPTPRTSCARRSRSCAPRSTWRSPIRTRASMSCARWARRCARRSTAASG